MKTSTLIDVVAMIDARIEMYEKADANNPLYMYIKANAHANNDFFKGALSALKSLGGELQSFIETDISSMESTTGE